MLNDFCSFSAPDGILETMTLKLNLGGTSNIVPGTFQLPTQALAGRATYAVDGGKPMLRSGELADAGTVTVTTVDATHLVGTFDVSLALPDGGRSALMGSFDAPYIGCH
jgi:hypothetical protein